MRKGEKWSKKWYLERATYGHKLLEESTQNEPDDYENFLWMDAESFDEFSNLVSSSIRKKDTVMRAAISPVEWLSLTIVHENLLRFGSINILIN